MFFDILQFASALAGVVLVLFLAYYLTKLYARKMGTSFGTGRNMKIVDRIPAGKGSAIVIIEVAGKQYMLGVTDGSINLLTELETPIPAAPEERAAQPSSFIKTLKSVVVRDNNDETIDYDKKQ